MKKEDILKVFTDNEIEDYNKLISLVGHEQAESIIKKHHKK